MAGAISPEAVVAISVFRARYKAERLEIEDISRTLLELEDRGFDVGDVALRKVPGGVYSEDVEAFVGRLLAAGYARARSPVEFLEDGLRICKVIIEDEFKENRAGLEAAAAALNFDLSRLIAPALP